MENLIYFGVVFIIVSLVYLLFINKRRLKKENIKDMKEVSYIISKFKLNPKSSAYYDLMLAQYLSNENTTFYSTAISETRIERLDYVSEFEETYDVLNVCNDTDFNCKSCEKCVRTMASLYALGKLDKYSKVFDTDDFKKHLAKRIAFVLAKTSDSASGREYHLEIVDMLKKRKVKIPTASHFIAFPLRIKYKAISIVKNNKAVDRWWRRKMNKQCGVISPDI